jgi:hypothetical protein
LIARRRLWASVGLISGESCRLVPTGCLAITLHFFCSLCFLDTKVHPKQAGLGSYGWAVSIMFFPLVEPIFIYTFALL